MILKFSINNISRLLISNRNKITKFNEKMNQNSNTRYSKQNDDFSIDTSCSYSENYPDNITQYHSTIGNSNLINNDDISDELNDNPNPVYFNKINKNDADKLVEWENNIKKVRFAKNNNNANLIFENSSEFALSSINGPKSFKSAMNSNNAENWQIAVNDELESIYKNNVWQIVNKPENCNVISTRWVFVKKMDKDGKLQKYKARLVARGFEQVYGVDYHETFAPVVRFTSIRLIMSIAINLNMYIHQMDVKTAFLNGKLNEDVYIEIPDGVDGDYSKQCCKLNRSLYGLKQSPLSWNIILDQFLQDNKLIRSEADFGVYVKTVDSNHLIVTIYVDDLLIASENLDLILNFKDALTKRFEMTDLGELRYILGIEVEQQNGIIKIHQRNYISELIKKFKLDDARTYNTPMEANIKLVKSLPSDEIIEKPYASLIGSLLYLSNCTRPDITFAVNRLSSFNSNPNEMHWKCAMRVLRYLKKTDYIGVNYNKSDNWNLVGYSDADWANDLETRKSTTGYLVTLNSNPISWNSRRQATVATSTAEAEYMAMYETVREILWIQKLLTDLSFKNNSVKIFCDNQSAIHIAKNPVMHQRSKHIDIKYHFIRQQVSDNNIELNYLSTKSMTADILTKPLAFPLFVELRSKLLNDIELRGSIENTNSNH